MIRSTTPILVLIAFVVACAGERADPVSTLGPKAAETYADIVFASYDDSVQAAKTLQQAIQRFVAEPSRETHAEAKNAWLAAREPYGQSEAYRFYGGPIDDRDGPEGLINAWPLDEAYVDYVQDAPGAGIVNNAAKYPEITAELLTSLNEAGAEENVSSGFHAIEFLLWGQDLSVTGPGGRSHEDYLDSGSAPNPQRRARYLAVATDLLVQHLEGVRAAWEPSAPDNFRAQFLARPPHEALQAMLTGIGVLSKAELAGERIYTAYDNQSQEDEHSCFSDNTHRDIITNAQGISNVLTGSYTRTDGSLVSGTSILDVVGAINETLSLELNDLNQATLQAVNELPIPFDRAISSPEQRPQVLESVYTLQDQGDKIAEAATALGLAINTALPE